MENATRGRKGWMRCQVGRNVEFSTERLETYCIAKWEPVVYDAMLVAAAIEFAEQGAATPADELAKKFAARHPRA